MKAAVAAAQRTCYLDGYDLDTYCSSQHLSLNAIFATSCLTQYQLTLLLKNPRHKSGFLVHLNNYHLSTSISTSLSGATVNFYDHKLNKCG